MTEPNTDAATAREAVRQVANMIVDTVRETGSTGAPGGIIYAALSASGVTLSQYQQLMDGLVRVRRLRRVGELYFTP